MVPHTATHPPQPNATSSGLRITRLADGWAIAWPACTAQHPGAGVTLYWTGKRDGVFGADTTALVHTSPAALRSRWKECSGLKLPVPDEFADPDTEPNLYGHDPARFRKLTVRHPWAEFICPGPFSAFTLQGMSASERARLPKTIENRYTSVVGSWRGTLLILAGLEPDMDAMNRFGLDPRRFVYGALLGTVELVDVVTNSTNWWAEPGRNHLVLRDNQCLNQPIGDRGLQGAQTPGLRQLSMVLRQLKGTNTLV